MSINKNYVMAGVLATALITPLSNITESYAAEIRVTTTRVNFRTGAGTNYTSIGVLEKGTKVTYIGTSGNWTKVQYNSKTGYIYSDYLVKEESSSTTTMYATADSGLNVRKGPSTSYSKVGTLSKGTAVTVYSTSNGWSKISANGIEGYVSSKYLSATKPSTSTGSSSSSNSSSVSSVLNLASNLIGKPYVWGAEGPSSFDCSGFTYYVYKTAAGITLPRVSSSQGTYGTTISKSNLKPGDLVFFDTDGSNNGQISHVGIYVGSGQMIHASSSKKKVIKSSIETTYWKNAFVRAKRVL